MILAPPARRSIWTPQPRLRLPSLTEIFAGGLQRDPSTGGAKRKSDGAGVRNVNSPDPCCCATYVRAKKCNGGAYADFCILKGSKVLPYYFKRGAFCYSVQNGNTEASTPFGTVVSDATLSGCNDIACGAIQARRCADDADVDLWFTASQALPFYFAKDGVHYYVDSSCNRSGSPGTTAAGYTSFGCARCAGCVAPKYLATFAGLTLQCDRFDLTKLASSPDGSYLVPMTGVGTYAPGCAGTVLTPLMNLAWCDGHSGGNPGQAQFGVYVYMTAGEQFLDSDPRASEGVKDQHVAMYAPGFFGESTICFRGQIPAGADCRGTITVTNNVQSVESTNTVYATGGTCTLVPVWT